ncbi:uncharacterized protein LOC144860708 [Branchiostoma floridae x Branchiostoma japonicum]
MCMPVSKGYECQRGIDKTVQSSTTDDTTDGQINHHTGKDDNNTTLRQIGPLKRGGDQANDMETGSMFTVTVGRNVIGLAANTMYATGSHQQPGQRELTAIPQGDSGRNAEDETADDCNDEPENHVYHNSEIDDIERLQQLAAEIGQRADKQENTAASINVQKDDSGLLKNPPTYVLGALRQDNNKGS